MNKFRRYYKSVQKKQYEYNLIFKGLIPKIPEILGKALENAFVSYHNQMVASAELIRKNLYSALEESLKEFPKWQKEGIQKQNESTEKSL